MSAEPRFDETALRALFGEVETPTSMEARWRSRVALAPEPAPADLPKVRRLAEVGPSRKRRAPWSRTFGVAVAALVAGGGIVGIVAVNRQPSPNPRPSIVETTTDAPTTVSKPPAQQQPSSSSSEPSQPTGTPPDAPGTQPGGGSDLGSLPDGGGGMSTLFVAAIPPPGRSRGPLTEWPDAANTGVPAGEPLRVRNGDLHITEAGAVVANQYVNGVIYVEAPDVTLRRVRVQPLSGAYAGIRQQAPRLRIEDSEVSAPGGGAQYGIRQEAAGLVLQRSAIHGSTSAATISSDATVVDSYLSDVQTSGNSSRIIVRHNTISNIAMLDDAGPVTDVTIENNQFDYAGSGAVIFAPYRSGSQQIRVTDNKFHGSAAGNPVPVSGWNDQAPGNIWARNVWFGTTDPVNP